MKLALESLPLSLSRREPLLGYSTSLTENLLPIAFLEFDKPYQDILDFYAYRNASGNYILCWDHARFVNHSFNSNCLTTAYDFEIAIRDIQPGRAA